MFNYHLKIKADGKNGLWQDFFWLVGQRDRQRTSHKQPLLGCDLVKTMAEDVECFFGLYFTYLLIAASCLPRIKIIMLHDSFRLKTTCIVLTWGESESCWDWTMEERQWILDPFTHISCVDPVQTAVSLTCCCDNKSRGHKLKLRERARDSWDLNALIPLCESSPVLLF